jgi:hypothetical protein
VPLHAGDLVGDVLVRRVLAAAFAPLVRRYQLLLNEPVETVQVDVGHDGRGDPALWSAGKRGVPLPVLQVPGLERVGGRPAYVTG